MTDYNRLIEIARAIDFAIESNDPVVKKSLDTFLHSVWLSRDIVGDERLYVPRLETWAKKEKFMRQLLEDNRKKDK